MSEVERTVLLVEDDPPLRELIERMVRQLGWGVRSARNAEEAMALAQASPGTIDLLITDIVLPHMNGFELERKLTHTHPETRVLFMSGYAGESVSVRGGLKESGRPFLLKPFTKGELGDAISQALA